jgi:hypothetical protein
MQQALLRTARHDCIAGAAIGLSQQYNHIFQLGSTRFRIPGRGWEENIKLNIKDKNMCWVHLVQENDDQWRTVVNTVMNLRVPQAD